MFKYCCQVFLVKIKFIELILNILSQKLNKIYTIINPKEKKNAFTDDNTIISLRDRKERVVSFQMIKRINLMS